MKEFNFIGVGSPGSWNGSRLVDATTPVGYHLPVVEFVSRFYKYKVLLCSLAVISLLVL